MLKVCKISKVQFASLSNRGAPSYTAPKRKEDVKESFKSVFKEACYNEVEQYRER